MKKIFIYLIFSLINFILFSQVKNLQLIPYPNKINIDSNNTFIWNEKINLFLNNQDAQISLNSLNEFLILNKKHIILPSKNFSNKNILSIIIDTTLDKNDENYTLFITSNKIEIKGSKRSCYYGIQTLKQILLNSFKNKSTNKYILPALNIEDKPSFGYRGFHLDVSRHFYSVKEIKKLIDIMSFFKLNIFHWHLTDDQGWRIEIKKYPKLTSIGSLRKETMTDKNYPPKFIGDKKIYGPYFYTQNQVRDIVNYASSKNINILPEIDIPGHSAAAVASYPELGYEGHTQEVGTYWGGYPYGVLNAGKDSVYIFVQNVMDEILDLFPYKYVHIGGDEVLKQAWLNDSLCQKVIKENNLNGQIGLQNYFMYKIEKYINQKGKKIIGWDEILEGEVSPTAAIMSWRGEEGGIEAANKKHEVIMTPGKPLYLDHFQSISNKDPLAIGGLNTTKDIYNYYPIPKNIAEENTKFILGAQVNLWTEYIKNYKHLEFMYFPRTIAFAEAVWTIKNNKNYDNFLYNLPLYFSYLQKTNTKYANRVYDIYDSFLVTDSNTLIMILNTDYKQGNIKYNYTNKSVKKTDKYFDKQIEIKQNMQIRANVFSNNKIIGNTYTLSTISNKAFMKNITLLNLPHKNFNNNLGSFNLVNGILGSASYRDNKWLGFLKDTMVAIIDFNEQTEFNNIKTNFINFPGGKIYLPTEIIIYISNDNINYTKIKEQKINTENSKIVKINILLDTQQKARYVKVIANNLGVIPNGYIGEGNKAWLLIDEIVVN